MRIKLLLILTLISSVVLSQTIQQNKMIELPNGTKMEFVYVQPGSFLMGSCKEEPGHQADESPQREVTISKGFYIGRYEVTQSQWESIMNENPAIFRTLPEADNLPVEFVTWNDCQIFIGKLNESGIGNFRLPTETEWEYACRAGTNTAYYWGDSMPESGKSNYAWANSRSNGKTHPVGEKLPNNWGLYDMSGNVWEWCSDWYAPYRSAERPDPGSPVKGKMKVFRGGSWFDGHLAHRSANRHKHAPDEKYTAVGLRLVLEIE